ncbi:MAG: single-stranded DNA-binding protein [Solobacterium sp.]|nr:single-stranded DNA-binding protein [Solobacterium sp.]MBQ6222223.1 single-stranded DNA-binding protein [Solobacterium sp.]MBR2670131.1 single-stranded DNA-binding protein [Solobacterium sp.]
MINRVVLVGRLTRDVEVRKTQSGLSVATFTVACDRRGSRDAQGQSQADFISCVAWRQSADFLGAYARKGALIAVDGKIQTRNYDDRDGKKVYVTEVVADTVQLLESRSQSQNRQDNIPAYTPDPEYRGGSDPFSADDFNTGPTLDISSDDLPF